MEISFAMQPSGVMMITLVGRLDIQGAARIDVQFSAVAASMLLAKFSGEMPSLARTRT
jgi:hypothetical protein